MRDAHAALGTAEEFDGFVAVLREQHRRRPSFLDELRKARM